MTGPEQHTGYTYGVGNELLKMERTELNYDKNSNMIAKGHQQHEEKQRGEHHGHDNNHHEGNGWSYTYDFENRLIKAEKKHTIVTYKYDPLGRRIEKRVKEGEHCRHEDEVVHTYVYDGQAIILEYETNGDGRHKKTEATKYVHGPGIDEPLAMTRDNEVYFYHQDGLGSVVALTDKRQKVVEAYEYDSFGNLNGDAKPMQPFTYTGREWDKETGLYYYRARYYDPMEGRFIQKDPIGFKGGINVFAYTGNNPVTRVDPTGLAFFAKRALTGMAWIPGISNNSVLDIFNVEASHEQLFFEDGSSPFNVGFFGDGTLHYDESSFGYNRQPGNFDDCIMRKAYKNVPLHKYHLIFPLEMKNNCQNWADAVRQEYYRLKNQ